MLYITNTFDRFKINAKTLDGQIIEIGEKRNIHQLQSLIEKTSAKEVNIGRLNIKEN